MLATHKVEGHRCSDRFLLLSSTAFNFLALRHLRLDQTTTIGFLTPLTVALLAGPFLGEWIGWRRAVAIVGWICRHPACAAPGRGGVPPCVPALLREHDQLRRVQPGHALSRRVTTGRGDAVLFAARRHNHRRPRCACCNWVWPATILGLDAAPVDGRLRRARATTCSSSRTAMPRLDHRAVPLHQPADALDGRVSGVRPGAGYLDAGRRRRSSILSGFYLFQRERVTLRAAAVAMTSEATPQR